jgi:hypothetical protein
VRSENRCALRLPYVNGFRRSWTSLKHILDVHRHVPKEDLQKVFENKIKRVQAWISLPTLFVSAQRLSERTVFKLLAPEFF